MEWKLLTCKKYTVSALHFEVQTLPNVVMQLVVAAPELEYTVYMFAA